MNLNSEYYSGGTQTPITIPKYSPSPTPTPTNQDPTAIINGPSSGIAGRPSAYTSTDSSDIDGNIVEYEWSIDGTVFSNLENPAYIFLYVGAFTVSLRVKDDDGAWSGYASITILVDADPTPSSTPSPSPTATPVPTLSPTPAPTLAPGLTWKTTIGISEDAVGLSTDMLLGALDLWDPTSSTTTQSSITTVDLLTVLDFWDPRL